MKSPTLKALATLLAQSVAIGSLSAQTIWDGEAADTNINSALNWNNNTVNPLNGTQAGTFGSAGSIATMNVDGYLSSLIFNRDSASGFTINGPGVLSVLASGSGATGNLTVGNTAGNGVSTVNSALRINTDAGGTRLLVIDNREPGTASESLVLAGPISATTPANAYGIRFGGSGSTRISGSLSNVSATTNIQQASVASNPMAGTVTIAGNQSLGSVQVNIAGTGGSVNGQVASTARIVMGDNTSDVQSWGNSSVNQAGTLEIRSTATAGSISLSNAASNGSSGGTLEVTGNLSATTLAIGGSAYSGILKVSGGTASFSGAATTGVTAGSKIVGGAEAIGTVTFASASNSTLGSAVAIGGGGTNENNVAIVKDGAGVLSISSANNTFSGGTTVVNGGASGAAGLVLGANQVLGTGPLVIGTAATAGNGARVRMAGFNQTVASLSSGSVGTRVLENFGAVDSVLTVAQTSDTTYSGFLRDRTASGAVAATGGNLGLVKGGSGTLTLSNTSNQYTGATVLNGGVLEVAQLTNGGIEKAITSTSGSATVSMADTTGLAPGMTFAAPTLPTGFSVSTVDGGTTITLNTSSGITGGSSTAFFGVASSLGLSSNAASNLVFGGGTLRYIGTADNATDRNFTINVGQNAKWDVANAAATLTLQGGASSSTGGLEKLGDGTLMLAGAQGYTGATSVADGILRLGASDRINDGSQLVLAGGIFDLNGFSEQLGTLGLSASGFIDLDSALLSTGSVSFANSSSLLWGAFTLSISGSNFGPTSVRFGTDALGLTPSQLASITVNGQGGASLTDDGYLTVIPEPSSIALMGGVFALVGVVLRRKRS